MSGETYTAPDAGWTCFHCGATYPPQAVAEARAHFGATPDAKPGCVVKLQAGERGVIRALRHVENERDELRVRLAAVRAGADEANCVERFHAMRGAPA